MDAEIPLWASYENARNARTWRLLFHEFYALTGTYWTSRKKWGVRWFTLLLVALTALQITIPIALNIWNKDLFNALESRSMDRFVFLTVVLLAIIVANVAITALHMLVKRRLQVSWRNWLTRWIVDEWMAHGRHYQLTYLPGDYDNPDGRIAEDVRIATEYAIDLGHSLLYSALLLISFCEILWSLSGTPELQVGGFSIPIPGYLIWVAFLYSAVGSSVALLLGRPLVRATNRRQTVEANFRFGLVHARENSFAIALSRGEGDERGYFVGLFGDLTHAWNQQTRALTNILLYSSSWSVVSQVFAILVISPRYIAGSITLGVLMQTVQAFQQATSALSWPIDNLTKIADWRASVERVLALHHGLCRVRDQTVETAIAGLVVTTVPERALTLRNVSATMPSGEHVIEPFTLSIAPGEKVLIGGDPHAADTLFKILAGLWPWGQGRVELPAGAAIFFMPQRPYLPVGSLRHAISYPSTINPYDEDRLHAILALVRLDYLAARLDEVTLWEQALSPGEQQRLGFGRLLLHRPTWVFMQDSMDALDPEEAALMMRVITEQLPGATLVAIRQHGTAPAEFGREVVLRRTDGSTSVEDRGQLQATAAVSP